MKIKITKIFILSFVSICFLSGCSTSSSYTKNESDLLKVNNSKIKNYTKIVIASAATESEIKQFFNQYDPELLGTTPGSGFLGNYIQKALFTIIDFANPAMKNIGQEVAKMSKEHKKILIIIPNRDMGFVRNILDSLQDGSLASANGYIWLLSYDQENEKFESVAKRVSSGSFVVKYKNSNF